MRFAVGRKVEEKVKQMKVVELGPSGVGKTSIVLQLQEKVFKKIVSPTVGSGVISHDVNTPNGVVSLRIWDTAGEERYRSFTGLYSQSAVAGILVFDLSDRDTFDSIGEWIKVFSENGDPNAVLVLVGNKVDLAETRKVPFEVAMQFARENRMDYYEVSAKTGQNVDLMFADLAAKLSSKSNLAKTEVTHVQGNREKECSC